MKFLLLLSIILIKVLCEDYYQLLGLSRKANEEQIRKAFKKLSLKYHPDKNKNNQEEAQTQFQKIVNAYEVLKDTELRQVYDKYGEEGLKQKQQQQQQQQGGNYNDFFSRFFGGNQGFKQKNPIEQPMFSNTDVLEMDMASLNRFFRRENVWVILFYRNDQSAQNIKTLWTELASKYYGIFHVAALNCAAETEICDDEYQVYEFPKVLVFPANIRQESQEFKGNIAIEQIAKFTIQFMESFVSIVTSENYNQFIKQEQHIVLLFTNKTSTPPLFKVLSKELKGKLNFGQVRLTDTKLLDNFKITKYPTLMVLTAPEEYQGVIYESNDFKKDQIMKFLREYAYTTKKMKKSAPTPKELSSSLIQSGSCNQKDNSLCFILIIDSGDPLTILQPLYQHYMEDKINFYYIQKHNLIYSQVFHEIDTFPTAIVVKPKKERYAKFSGKIDVDNLKDFIDQIISGNIQFKPMLDSLEINIFSDDL